MTVAKIQDQIFRTTDQCEIAARWAREAEDRIEAYDRGEIAAFPIDEVFSSLQSRRKR